MVKSNVRASWRGGAQTVDECGQLVAQLMNRLAAVHPTLANWHNRAHDEVVVTTDHADLVARLLDGRQRGETEGRVIESLGYSLSWANGVVGNPETTGLLVDIGRPATSALGNGVSLTLPDPNAALELYDPDIARKILHTLIGLFSPDWLLWGNHSLYTKQKGPDYPTPDGRGMISGKIVGYQAGWANYLDDSNTVNFDPRLLPAGATVERLDSGTLVLLGEHPADPPLDDVLQVRRAMGYQVPTPAQPSGAATANTTPPWTPLTTPAKPSPRTEHTADADSTPPTPDDSGTRAFGDQTTDRPVEGS